MPYLAPMRDFQKPGRSAVHSMRGMIATSHPLASEAGASVLREGGDAVEASIAAAAVLAVVEPHMTGIGGDCFALIGHADGRLEGINGSGRSSAALDPSVHAASNGHLPLSSPHAVTVPGAIAAWAALASERPMGLDRLLAPAIELAENGFPVAPRVAADWSAASERLLADKAARDAYLRQGAAPAAGTPWRLPALARTLRAVAARGAPAFYEGEIAEDIVHTLQDLSDVRGTLTPDDLARHRTERVEPLLHEYAGRKIVELPPSNQGVTALAMLGIMERHRPGAMAPLGVDAMHMQIEASRLAYAERDASLADPAAMKEGTEALLSPDRLDRLAGRIDPDRATALREAPRAGTDTVYLCAVDRDGLAVSFINSLFHAFGSGICTRRSGILLQNRGCGFSIDPSHPNALGPAKRPLHTLIPGMIVENGRIAATFGVMGGQYQAHGHAHVASLMLDHGFDPQAALDAPRLFHEGEDVLVERGLDEATVAGLAARGHAVREAPSPIGGGQVIAIDHANGVLVGGSDPRKDGCVIGLA